MGDRRGEHAVWLVEVLRNLQSLLHVVQEPFRECSEAPSELAAIERRDLMAQGDAVRPETARTPLEEHRRGSASCLPSWLTTITGRVPACSEPERGAR